MEGNKIAECGRLALTLGKGCLPSVDPPLSVQSPLLGILMAAKAVADIAALSAYLESPLPEGSWMRVANVCDPCAVRALTIVNKGGFQCTRRGISFSFSALNI